MSKLDKLFELIGTRLHKRHNDQPNLNELIELIRTSPIKKGKHIYTISNSWVYERRWHKGYVMFSFNKGLFGFVYHDWYPSGPWEAPNSEYDFNWEKGFKVYDDEYRCDTIDELKYLAKNYPDSYDLYAAKVICIPVFWKYPMMVGHTVDNGKTIDLFEDEPKALNKTDDIWG